MLYADTQLCETDKMRQGASFRADKPPGVRCADGQPRGNRESSGAYLHTGLVMAADSQRTQAPLHMSQDMAAYSKKEDARHSKTLGKRRAGTKMRGFVAVPLAGALGPPHPPHPVQTVAI